MAIKISAVDEKRRRQTTPAQEGYHVFGDRNVTVVKTQ